VLAGDKLQQPRLGSGLAIQMAEQGGGGFVIADEVAAIHVAVANAMLQRNAPLPATGVRRGTCVGRELSPVVAGHGHRAIDGQPLRPVFVAGVQGLLDQEPSEARAVNEQIAFHPLAGF